MKPVPIELTRHAPWFFALPWHRQARAVARKKRRTGFLGPPGSGKTAFAEELSRELMGKDPISIQCSSDMQGHELWGWEALKGGETVDQRAGLSTCLEDNRALILNDFSAAPSAIKSNLLAMRHANGTEVWNPYWARHQKVPSDFLIIFTSNGEAMSRCASKEQRAVTQALISDYPIVFANAPRPAEIRGMLMGQFPMATPAQIEQTLSAFDEVSALVSGQVQDDPASGAELLSFRAAFNYLMLLIDNVLSEEEIREITLINSLVTDADLHAAIKLRYRLEK